MIAAMSQEILKSPCSPSELKERIRAGDPRVVDDLFRCTNTSLERFLRARCGNRTDAEDALQETFVNAQRSLQGYRGDASPKNWLFRVAANACTRMRRGKKNARALHVDIDAVSLTDERTPNVDALIEMRMSSVVEALQALDEIDRAILLLKDGESLSSREIADALSLSESAVKSRLFRARRSVREAVGAAPEAS
jgi:RNA polymerase sigma-70 factor (ECF subfamily)